MKVSPNAWMRFNTTAMLGWSLFGQGKHAEGEPLLRAGYAGMKAREGELHPIDRIRLAEAARRLAELCAATNRPDEAATWRAEATNALREQAPPPRPVTR